MEELYGCRQVTEISDGPDGHLRILAAYSRAIETLADSAKLSTPGELSLSRAEEQDARSAGVDERGTHHMSAQGEVSKAALAEEAVRDLIETVRMLLRLGLPGPARSPTLAEVIAYQRQKSVAPADAWTLVEATITNEALDSLRAIYRITISGRDDDIRRDIIKQCDRVFGGRL
jgi:hypothetical protein